jgi:prepilin-type N-terminal cleavage/methylation domain-containing protein
MLYNLKNNRINYQASRNRGFSLIEMMVVVAILAIILAVAASVFTSILGSSKQEAKIGEAQLESVVGMDLLVSDIQHAGFGLPYSFENSAINYTEAVGATAAAFNDAPGVPRAILGNQVADAFGNLSSYLVIRASNVGMNAASQRWAELGPTGAAVGNANDQLQAGDMAIVLNVSKDARRQLVMTGSTYSAAWGSIPTGLQPSMAGYDALTGLGITYVAYGLDGAVVNRPFNRADYFISGANVPANCAPNSGVLTKNTVSQADGTLVSIPIIDCVASFQVFYGLDINADGTVDQYTQDLTTWSSINIRNMLKEVWVYILMHEGRRDPEFTSAANITLGSSATGTIPYAVAANQRNYRWKVLSFVVRPKNL